MNDQKPVIPREPNAIRRALLEDPNTAGIAKSLGVSLEDYIEQVIRFAMNPKAEPIVSVLKPEIIREKGGVVPDGEAMGKYLVEAVAVAKVAHTTEFADPKAEKVELSGKDTAQPTDKTDAELKAQIDKQLRANRPSKG